jgi:glycosyltransferase involved in cell wall biosynthesis
MRLLFLNYEYPPIGGGGANANAYLFREYSNIPDLHIDCVTSGLANRDETVQLAENITLHRLAVGKKQLHYWTQREVLTWLWRADRCVNMLRRKQRYDLCHAFFGFPSGAVAWHRRGDQPYLVSLRGSDVPGFNLRFSGQYVVLKPLFRRIWSAAGAVVANSQGLRRLAGEFMPQLPIAIIPNGIDTCEFMPAAAEDQVAGRILCVSRLVERKGVQDLLAAMPRVLQQVPRAQLLIVGEGDLLEPLKQRTVQLGLADQVEFRGYVPHSKLPDLYRSAELFMQPSFYEGMSNTVLEAMASGLPIVATGEGGKEELLQDNAVVAPYGDPQALAACVTALLLGREKLACMGERSRQIAEQYSWAAVARSYLDIYAGLACGNQGILQG